MAMLMVMVLRKAWPGSVACLLVDSKRERVRGCSVKRADCERDELGAALDGGERNRLLQVEAVRQ